MSQRFEERPPVAFGGMMVALSVLLAAGTKIFPILIGFFAAIPLALAGLHLSTRDSLVSAAAATLLVGLFFGPFFGLAFLFQYAILGVFTGLAVKKQWTFRHLFLVAWVIQCIGMLVFLGIQFAIAGFDLTATLKPYLNMENEMIAIAKEMHLFERMQTTKMDAYTIETLFRQSMQFFMKILPAAYAGLTAVMVAVHLFLFRVVCKRLRLGNGLATPAYDQVIMPVTLLIPLIGCWIILLAKEIFPSEILWLVALNGMVICIGGMGIGGLSLILHNIRWRALAMPFKMVYALIFFLMGQYLLVVAAFIGIFDTILDFRHLRTQTKE